MLRKVDFDGAPALGAARRAARRLGFPAALGAALGLIVAAALIRPEKKLSVLDAQSVLNRFEERRFAAGANREQIQTCSEMGLTLEEFIEIGLQAMKDVSDDLGL